LIDKEGRPLHVNQVILKLHFISSHLDPSFHQPRLQHIMDRPPAHEESVALTESITTTFFISNLHCPSCITSIQFCLADLNIQPTSISHSIIHHSLTIRHSPSISYTAITSNLEKAGFEVYSVVQANREQTFKSWQPEDTDISQDWGLEQAVQRWKHAWQDKDTEEEKSRKRKRHVEQCVQCLAELQQSCDSEEALMEKVQRDFDTANVEKGICGSSKDGDVERELAAVVSATPELFRSRG
jgi:Cu+-exporting ATPase